MIRTYLELGIKIGSAALEVIFERTFVFLVNNHDI